MVAVYVAVHVEGEDVDGVGDEDGDEDDIGDNVDDGEDDDEDDDDDEDEDDIGMRKWMRRPRPRRQLTSVEEETAPDVWSRILSGGK